MDDHQFIAVDYPDIPIPYNLVFSEKTHDIIPLPAPSLLVHIVRGGYRIMPYDIIAYWNAQAVAEESVRSEMPKCPPHNTST